MLSSISSRTPSYTARPVVDGKVDSSALEGMANAESLITDISDSRLQDVLSGKVKNDGSTLGEEWTGSYRSLPIYSNRGIIGLDEKSSFKTEGQSVDVDWHKKTVTVTTAAPGAEEGHKLQASMDWQRNLITDSVTESTYLIAR